MTIAKINFKYDETKMASTPTTGSKNQGYGASIWSKENSAQVAANCKTCSKGGSENEKINAALEYLKLADEEMYNYLQENIENGSINLLEAIKIKQNASCIKKSEDGNKASGEIYLYVENISIDSKEEIVCLAAALAHEGVHVRDKELIEDGRSDDEFNAQLKAANACSVNEEGTAFDESYKVLRYAVNEKDITKAGSSTLFQARYFPEEFINSRLKPDETDYKETQLELINTNYSESMKKKYDGKIFPSYDADKDNVIDMTSWGHGLSDISIFKK